MTSADYAVALDDFKEEISKLGNVNLASSPSGRRVIECIFGDGADLCMLGSSFAANVSSTDASIMAPSPAVSATTKQNDVKEICQLCSKLRVSREIIDDPSYDTPDLQRNHAKFHFNQYRAAELCFETDFHQILSACFPGKREKRDVNACEFTCAAGGIPKNATGAVELLSNFGRGKRRKISNASETSTVPKKRKTLPKSDFSTLTRKNIIQKQLYRQDSIVNFAYSVIQNHLRENESNASIKCRRCRFSVSLQRLHRTLGSNIHPRSVSVYLVEHALEHIGRKLKFRCPFCPYKCDKYLAICDHATRAHDIKVFNFKGNGVSSDDEANSAVRHCFGDVPTAKKPVRAMVVLKGTTSLQVDGGRANDTQPKPKQRKRRAYSCVAFMAEYCNDLYQRQALLEGTYSCHLCGRRIRAGYRSRILWNNLLVHALRHLWIQLYGRAFSNSSCRIGIDQHPRETGEMMTRCFGNNEYSNGPKDGQEVDKTLESE